MRRLAVWLSDLRVAIVLLLLIALASAVGTGIPQGDPPASYVEAYSDTPWLGLLNGEQVLQLQLDHAYARGWVACSPAAGSWHCGPGWGWR